MSVYDEIARLDAVEAAWTLASLRRQADAFRYAPHVYYALLRALEARCGDPAVTDHPAAGAPDVLVEGELAPVVPLVEGQAGPFQPVRRRVLCESTHFDKPRGGGAA